MFFLSQFVRNFVDVAGKGSKSRINSTDSDKRLLGPFNAATEIAAATNVQKDSTLTAGMGQVLFDRRRNPFATASSRSASAHSHSLKDPSAMDAFPSMMRSAVIP